jgi:pyocin large subunit-like protein
LSTERDPGSRFRFVLLWLVPALLLWASGPGFRSKAQFDEHYRKHGSEFGDISQQQYLRLAQALRDAPAGGQILQSVRADGVFTKFDKSKGYFGAYNPDRTIRTFFIPNEGERYFHRQAKRHD